VSHALGYNDSVRYVSYSTCSIYWEEDEKVVKDILSKHGKWQVAPNLKDIVAKTFKLKKDQKGKDK